MAEMKLRSFKNMEDFQNDILWNKISREELNVMLITGFSMQKNVCLNFQMYQKTTLPIIFSTRDSLKTP